MNNHMICTAHEGVSWIVCWTIRSEAIGYVDTDYYEAFESLAEAKTTQQEIDQSNEKNEKIMKSVDSMRTENIAVGLRVGDVGVQHIFPGFYSGRSMFGKTCE